MAYIAEIIIIFKCSARCGEGIRTRNQLCLLKTSGGQSKQVDPILCTGDRLPERTRPNISGTSECGIPIPLSLQDTLNTEISER